MASRTTHFSRPIRVGILVFDEVEELDFVGPWEVFGAANRVRPELFRTRLLSPARPTIRARYGMMVGSVGSLYRAPAPDLLVIPGGPGRKRAMKNARLIRYLERAHNRGMVLASVCTGSFILAAARLLDGRAATTHHNALAELRAYPQIKVLRRRIVDEGDVLTAAGISAGIDLALHLVRRFAGVGVATAVAKTMEYTGVRHMH